MLPEEEPVAALKGRELDVCIGLGVRLFDAAKGYCFNEGEKEKRGMHGVLWYHVIFLNRF